MALWGCGLDVRFDRPSTGERTTDFIKLAEGEELKVVSISWDEILYYNGGSLYLKGTQLEDVDHDAAEAGNSNATTEVVDEAVYSAITSHHGTEYIFNSQTSSIIHIDKEKHLFQLIKHDKPITHIAADGSGKVAVAIRASSEHSELLTFPSIHAFTTWLHTFDSDDDSSATFNLPNSITSIIASATAFAALTASGQIYTWGDARYPDVLGRPVGTQSNLSHEPALVSGTAGQTVTRIATSPSGNVMAAVTAEGDAYIWGRDRMATSLLREEEVGKRMEMLEEVDAFGIARVVLPRRGGEGDEEEEDVSLVLESVTSERADREQQEAEIRDVAVGDGHLLILDDSGIVWAVGDDSNGQLGLGKGNMLRSQRMPLMVKTFESLKEEGKVIRGVYCGEQTSYVVVETGT